MCTTCNTFAEFNVQYLCLPNVHQLPCVSMRNAFAELNVQYSYQTQCATPLLGLSPNVHQLPCDSMCNTFSELNVQYFC